MSVWSVNTETQEVQKHLRNVGFIWLKHCGANRRTGLGSVLVRLFHGGLSQKTRRG